MTSIFLCNVAGNAIANMLAEHQDAFLNKLPTEQVQKLKSLRNYADFCEQLAGKLLLLYALKKCGRELNLANLKFNSYQRPYLPEAEDFNISHTSGYAACIISNAGQIGIDIEKVNDISLADFVMFLSEQETEAIYNDRLRSPATAFYNLWTKKESILKAVGKGLSHPLRDVKIVSDLDHWYSIVDDKKWYIYHLHDVELPYCCHYTADFPAAKPHIENVSVSSFYNLI